MLSLLAEESRPKWRPWERRHHRQSPAGPSTSVRSQRDPLIAETIEGKPLRFWVITGSQRGSRLDGPSNGHGCVAGVLEVHELPATDTFPNETAESRRFVFPDSIALTAET